MPRPKGSLNKSTLALIEDKKRPPIVKSDEWSNFVAGLGASAKNKVNATEYGSFYPLDDDTLSNMYMGDGLSARIINCIADDMTREWIELEGGSAKAVKEELLRLEAENRFNEALRWQRLYGGAVIVVGAMDGQKPDKPLNTQKIKNIEYLKTIARTDIPISECVFDKEPTSPTFGKILLYKINMHVNDTWVPLIIHHSRIIPFFNDPIPPRIRSQISSDNRYWGMSSLQAIYESVRDLGGITQSVANLLYEFLIGKYKFANLNEMMATGNEGLLVKRVEIMNLTKSMINGVILGEDEEYTRDYATLAGLPEVIDRFMLQLCGSTGIPVTRLFGRSPAGLNATGENDLRNYYDIIEANQRNKLQMPLRRTVGLLSSWLKVDPPEFEFNSLYQMTEQEKADYEKTEAETDKIKAETEKTYVEMAARDSSEIRQEKGWAAKDVKEEPEDDE